MLTILLPSKVVYNVFSDLALVFKMGDLTSTHEMHLSVFNRKEFRHRFPV